MRDIDAPTTFFFNLERSVGQRKQVVCLRLPDGQVTSEPAEMRRHAVSFYTDLFKAEGCDVEAADELFQGLPQLSPAQSDTLGSDITLEELTSAWHGLQVLTPPPGLMKQLQRLLVDFFWSGHHWVPASVLYLPVAEGGQGLVDITARTAAFRLQAAQRLLYGISTEKLAEVTGIQSIRVLENLVDE
ncbi:hypothetical protein NHX12_008617, partial [Muraenolepis orangiensis]